MVDAARRPVSDCAPGPSLTIEYHNSAEDLTALKATTAPYYRWLRRVPILAMGALVVLLMGNFVSGKPPSRKVLIPVLFAALAGSMMRDAEERRLRILFHQVDDARRRRATVSPTGLETGFPPDVVCWGWHQVVRISSDDHCLFLFCKQPPGIGEILIIPRRAFRTPADSDAYLRLAQRFQSAHQPSEGGMLAADGLSPSSKP